MSAPATAIQPALQVERLRSGYFGRTVVFDVSFAIPPGKVTALLGHNGAGKTTTLKAIAGLLPAYAGTITLHGEPITGRRAADRVRRGLVYLPQERAVFGSMTVRDNLLLGATLVSDPAQRDRRYAQCLELFPILQERAGQLAGTMSGGQQRMLAISIALMAGARVLLLDEPSLGLAPSISQTLLQMIKQLAEREQMAVLLVEQAVAQALDVADHVYVMRSGQIVADETRSAALAREHWWELF
jgi:branched-chain amino acid transport system ATP-binding protein